MQICCFIKSIIIIIKTSAEPKWEKQDVWKLISQTHKHLRHGKLKKRQLKEATNGNFTLKPKQRSGAKQSVGKAIPHMNLGQQETTYKLGRSTHRHFEL